MPDDGTQSALPPCPHCGAPATPYSMGLPARDWACGSGHSDAHRAWSCKRIESLTSQNERRRAALNEIGGILIANSKASMDDA